MDMTSAPSSSAAETPDASSTAVSSPASSQDTGSRPVQGDDRTELLKVVQSVVKEGEDTEGGTPDPAPAEPETKPDTDPSGETPAAEGKADDELSQDDWKNLKPRTRKSIERLRGHLKAAQADLDTLRPQAEAFRRLNEYMETNQLTVEDTNLLLGVGAALRRGDFKAFLDGVRPYIQLAEEAVGARFPADIQEQVDGGYITEEAARELSTTRHKASQLESTVRQRDLSDHAASLRSAVNGWEEGIRKQDPDYGHKQGAVLRYAKALIAERGAPKTPAEAVALVTQAYGDVNRDFGAVVRPKLQPTRPTPSSTPSATTAAPEPKTMLEAAMQALQRSRGG